MTQTVDPTRIEGRRIELGDLIEAGLLQPGQRLVWHRPRVGETYAAEVTDGATIRLEDGREFSTPSGAAMNAAPTCRVMNGSSTPSLKIASSHSRDW